MRERTLVQRSKRSTPEPQRPALQDLVRSGTSSGGKSLDTTARATMEPRFGHSFADVRVHADEVAATSAEALQAHAYTVGQDIVFGAGEYAPDTSEGQHLLAHELTHVVQQRNAPAAALNDASVSQPGDASETEAASAAGSIADGSSAQVRGTAGLQVARLFDLFDEKPGDGLFGPYAYGGVNKQGGVDAGYGGWHAEGKTGGAGLAPGESYKLKGSSDYGAGVNLGAWSNDTDGDRYGWNLGGKALGFAGEAQYKQANGATGVISGDVSGPSVDVGAHAGSSGFSWGAQANIASGSVTGGTAGTESDESNRFGLSAGLGAAVRGSWGDSDKDGYREYGAGVDLGPVSVDLKTEDPLRSAVGFLNRQNMIGAFLGPGLPEKGNMTEAVANQFGLSIRNADLSTTLGVLSDPSSIKMPDLGLPDFSLPDLPDLGGFNPFDPERPYDPNPTPSLPIPGISLPDLGLPDFSLPDLPDLGGFNPFDPERPYDPNPTPSLPIPGISLPALPDLGGFNPIKDSGIGKPFMPPAADSGTGSVLDDLRDLF